MRHNGYPALPITFIATHERHVAAYGVKHPMEKTFVTGLEPRAHRAATRAAAKGSRDPHYEVWSACDGLVEAWEKTRGRSQSLTIRRCAHWLAVHMSPAINKARRALGREIPQ